MSYMYNIPGFPARFIAAKVLVSGGMSLRVASFALVAHGDEEMGGCISAKAKWRSFRLSTPTDHPPTIHTEV
jgi:hypothetical protein